MEKDMPNNEVVGDNDDEKDQVEINSTTVIKENNDDPVLTTAIMVTEEELDMKEDIKSATHFSNSSSNKCPVCNCNGTKLCQGCHTIYYCSNEHQKEDWKRHKKRCCPYVIKETAELGKHLMASRNLQAGTIIFQELPISYGPRVDDDSSKNFSSYCNDTSKNKSNNIPLCLSCCKRMTGKENNLCSKCKWPICGPSCSKAKEHAENECTFFKQNKIKYNSRSLSSSKKPISQALLYRGILILRLLLKKEVLQNNNKVSEQLNSLQWRRNDGSNERNLDKATLMFFKNYFKLSSAKLSDFEEWNKWNGVLEVNSYSIDRAENENEEPSQVQLLFLKSSRLTHSCVPNCSWGVGYSPYFTMKVRSARSIQKGEIISVSYNQSWNYYGTPRRKEMILETAGFVCGCERCDEENLTEFRTFMSALKCTREQCSGYLLSQKEMKEYEWKCTKSNCPTKISDEIISNEIRSVESELNKLQSICSALPSPLMGLGLLDDFIHRYTQTLHSNHWIFQQVSRFIIGIQGIQLLRLELKNLNQFIQHCAYLLRIFDILSPGISLDRALLQMYLSRALFLIYTDKNKNNGQNEVTIEDKHAMLKRIKDLQNEAWLYWKDDIQTKQLNEDIGFEARSLQNEMVTVLSEISNL